MLAPWRTALDSAPDRASPFHPPCRALGGCLLSLDQRPGSTAQNGPILGTELLDYNFYVPSTKTPVDRAENDAHFRPFPDK